MLDKLKAIYDRYLEVEKLISSPDAMNDMKLYVQLNREYKDLIPIVKAYHEYKNVVSNIESSKEILKEEKDEEMREMAKMELDGLLPRKEEMDEEIKILLIPKDSEDAKNAVMEIRAGTGGDEACIFAGDLYKMYTSFAFAKGWNTELVDIAEGTSGGYKEIIFNINGDDVYDQEGEIAPDAGENDKIRQFYESFTDTNKDGLYNAPDFIDDFQVVLDTNGDQMDDYPDFEIDNRKVEFRIDYDPNPDFNMTLQSGYSWTKTQQVTGTGRYLADVCSFKRAAMSSNEPAFL